MDGAANVYAATLLSASVPAPFPGGSITTRPLGATNYVVVAYAPDGAHRWDRQIAGRLDMDFVRVGVRDGGSLFVAGTFVDELEIGDGLDVARPGVHLFVGELDRSTGRALRVGTFSVPGEARVMGVAPLPGALWLLGWVDRPSVIGSTAVDGGFLLELDSLLTVRSVIDLRGSTAVHALAVRPDGRGFAIAGQGRGVVELGCAPVGDAGSSVVFVALHDASGRCEWVYALEDAAYEPTSLAVDDRDQVFASGWITSAVDFGGGLRTPAMSGRTGTVLSIDPAGAYAWDHRFESPDGEGLFGVAAFAGRVVAVGSFRDRITIGASTVGGNPHLDSIVVELTAAGAIRRTLTFGSDQGNSATAVAVGRGGSTVVSGSFSGRITLGTGTYVGPAAYLTRLGS